MENKINIAFYANDIGPAKNLGVLIAEALKRGHRVSAVLNGQIKKKLILDPETNLLITGLSSDNFQEELQLGKLAQDRAIPWIILADTHKSWGRQTTQDKIGGAILLIASPAEIKVATKFGYRQIVFLGGPPLWQDFAEIKAATIERQEGEKIILVGGGKRGDLNNVMLITVISAMNQIGDAWRLIFKPHPNEYKETINPKYRQRILSQAKLLKTSAELNNLLTTVDLSIHLAGATATIIAAYLRRPVISYEDQAMRQRLKQVSGSTKWYPAEMGACLKAEPKTLKGIIEDLFYKDGIAKLHKRQKQIYPLPLFGDGLRVEEKILNYIENL